MTMTLDDAILHAEEQANACSSTHPDCAAEHRQLAVWLRELRDRQRMSPSPVNLREAAPEVILRMALREYQDAATDAFCAWRFQDPDTTPALGRYHALSTACQEILSILCNVVQGTYEAIDATKRTFSNTPSNAPWVVKVRDDLIFRLCGNEGRIPAELLG